MVVSPRPLVQEPIIFHPLTTGWALDIVYVSSLQHIACTALKWVLLLLPIGIRVHAPAPPLCDTDKQLQNTVGILNYGDFWGVGKAHCKQYVVPELA